MWLDAVHKWVQPGRPAPSRCAKCSGKKCFTHFHCVTCWLHTFQLCYLLTRNLSVVSMNCSNWITVEPEWARTGMRVSALTGSIEASGVWPCIGWGACFKMWDRCFVHLHYVKRSLPCALDRATQSVVCPVLPALFCFPTAWEVGYLTSCSRLFSSCSWFFGVGRFLSWTSWVCGMKGMR